MPYEVIDDQNMVNNIKKGKCPFCNKNTVKKAGMAPKAMEGKFGPIAEYPMGSEFYSYTCSNIECEKYDVELLIPCDVYNNT